jgi:hypothetical protein
MNEPKARLIPLLELDAWVRPEGSTLKSIFDNLRNYPLLLVLLFAVRVLREEPGAIARVSEFTLGCLLAVLSLLTVFQTAVLMSLFFVWFFFSEYRERLAAQPSLEGLSKASLLLKLTGVVLFLLFSVVIAAACFISAGKFLLLVSHMRLPG